MGSLVENGLQESLSADETELPLFSHLTDKAGQVLSPEKKVQLANELATVMMRQLTAAAATPAASPTRPMTGPMQNFQQALAVSVAQASSGINFNANNPMQQASNDARASASQAKQEADLACIKFTSAVSQHMKAGADLGLHMEVNKELLCLDHNTIEGQARILELQQEHSSILQMKDNAVSDALASADKYKTFCEEQMWKVLTTSNVRYDKAVYAGFDFPQVIEPGERKATLLSFMEWTKRAPVVKKYYALVSDMRAMATVMDAVTGIYEKPRKAQADAGFSAVFSRQDEDLATELRAAVTRIEYTSMWRGSASIGAGDYRELYHVDPKSGLDMLYVWISQYVVIETGTDRTDLLMQLKGIEGLFEGPSPMATNEQAIRNLLEKCNEGGVTPDWLSHGSRCVKAVINRGQLYSDECSRQGLRKGSTWSKYPQSADVTRLLLDLITLTKQIDNEEQVSEQDGSTSRSRGSKMGKMAAMQAEVFPDTLENELAKAVSSEADTLSTGTRDEIQAFLVEHHPTINLKATKHNDKLVAGAVLLKNGQELTLEKLNRATRMVGKGSPSGNKGSETWEFVCAAKFCNEKVRRDGFYCNTHWDRSSKGGKSKGRGGKGDSKKRYRDDWSDESGKGRYGRKGKKGGKGKKGKVRITTADGDNKVTSYMVDAYTISMIAKIKEQGGQVMTAEQAKQHKAASTEAKFQSLIQ